MFQQVSQRRSAQDTEEDDFRAFVFNSTNPDSEDSMVCPLDNMEWELKVRNQAMKKGCASVQMDGLKRALFMVRVVVDTIVQVMYILMQITIALFRLIIPMNGENEFGQILAELEFWFNKLIIIIVESIKQLANMLFNLIFSTGPLGSVMKTILMWLCKLMQAILEAWNATGMCIHHTHTPIRVLVYVLLLCQEFDTCPCTHTHTTACRFVLKPLVIPALRFLASIISRIVYFFKLNDAVLDTLYQIINHMNKIKCNETLNCDYPTSEKFDAEFGALPVATRCWADFSPEIDSSDAFSCTASDTCRVSNLEYGQSLNEFGLLVEDGNQVVCDSCPLQPGGLVNQFGCDTYTKQCTCNRCVRVCCVEFGPFICMVLAYILLSFFRCI
jgi:hypothetical protein